MYMLRVKLENEQRQLNTSYGTVPRSCCRNYRSVDWPTLLSPARWSRFTYGKQW